MYNNKINHTIKLNERQIWVYMQMYTYKTNKIKTELLWPWRKHNKQDIRRQQQQN